MPNKLIKLPNFSYTALDFDTIIDDVQRLIKEHQEYSENWDDFLESDAGRMFVETMSYIIEKQSSKTDWTAREMFISTATQRQSLIELLKLINYRTKLPTSSTVNVSAKLAKWIPSFNLPIRENLQGKDTTGKSIIFELIEMAEDGKPDYDFQYRMETGDENNRIVEISNIPFYQGRTAKENDIYLDGIDNESFTLGSYPVIENSIRVYSLTKDDKELPEVLSFISPEAQQESLPEADKLPPYQVTIDEFNRAIISFGPKAIVTTPNKGERISVVYRIGGGKNTNIVSGAINQTRTYLVNNIRSTVIYSNPSSASGGTDEEDLEEARLIAPLTLRTANKTATHEDYIIHVEQHNSVMKADIVSKENEPKEILEEYGYRLPPLDTWIYVVPQRTGWETMDPNNYNQRMLISRPYLRHGTVDEEIFDITALNQTVYLKKYKKNKGFAPYVTLHEDTPENIDWMAIHSFIEETDFTINKITGEFTRIDTSSGGNIPSGDHTLKIRWIYDTVFDDDGNVLQDTSELYHFNETVHQFTTSGSDQIITLDNSPNSLYPNFEIIMTNKRGDITYKNGIDYNINWVNGQITKVVVGDISDNEKVIVQYADKWVQDEYDLSEETSILESIADKKMVCVDNYIKDSVYSTFDMTATVYCYKNLRNKVQKNIKEYLKEFYTLYKSNYGMPILKADLIKYIMDYDGVRFAEISYLGHDYHKYKKYVNDDFTLEELNDMNASNVEYKIEAKYNELITLANDEYDGAELPDNQIHGLTLTFKDA